MLQLFDTHCLLILTVEDTCRIHCCHCCLLPFGFQHHVEAKIESLCLWFIIHSVQEVESVMLAASCWYWCWGLEQPSDRTVVHFLQWPFLDFGIVVVLQGHILLDSLAESYSSWHDAENVQNTACADVLNFGCCRTFLIYFMNKKYCYERSTLNTLKASKVKL